MESLNFDFNNTKIDAHFIDASKFNLITSNFIKLHNNFIFIIFLYL